MKKFNDCKFLISLPIFLLAGLLLFSCASSVSADKKTVREAQVPVAEKNSDDGENVFYQDENAFVASAEKNEDPSEKTNLLKKNDHPEEHEKKSEGKIESDGISSQKNAQIKSDEEKNALQPQKITLLFAGDIMAHGENYRISDFSKIWRDVKDVIESADLAFANIESPVDTTKKISFYPCFNMSENYLKAAISAGFDVFSLCNNHTNDQGLGGILETMKTTEKLAEEKESEQEKNEESERQEPSELKKTSESSKKTGASESEKSAEKIYFSGLKQKHEDFSFNMIEKNGWKILFLPITELLNSPLHSDHVNFVPPDKNSRKKFIEFCKTIRNDNPCDIFVLSVHTSEPEYTRTVTERQDEFYMELLDAGVDILWANHAHIIKDRKFVFNAENRTEKLIMYANGNTISGQRRKPELSSQNPNGERDNTGDGLLYSVTLEKENGRIRFYDAKPIFITTYINTANEFVIKKLNEDFIDYLVDVNRKDWAQYIRRRIKITNSETKDLILWQ